jgi:hypothetical protein
MPAVNRDPTRAQLRSFGLVMLAGMAVVGALLWYRALPRETGWQPSSWGWTGSPTHLVAVVLWGLALAVALVCHMWYSLGRVLYVGWMTMAMYLGLVMTTLLLSILFIVLLPVFSLIRLKDPLRLRLRSSGSYWEAPTPHEPTLDRTRRPF